MLKHVFHAATLATLSLPALLHAAPVGQWDFDPSVLAESGSDLLKRAPPSQMDAVFQAVHAVAANTAEAPALSRCCNRTPIAASMGLIPSRRASGPTVVRDSATHWPTCWSPPCSRRRRPTIPRPRSRR